MRTLLAGLVTSGGLLATIAFFLPWVAVSCNGNTLGTVAPLDRAKGVEAEPASMQVGGARVELATGTDSTRLEPARGYWLLLLVALLHFGVGIAIALRPAHERRRLGSAAAALALVGLGTTIRLGLGDKLGVGWPNAVAPGVDLRIVLEPGVWLSVVGYAVGLSGGIAAAVLRGHPLD